MQPWNINFSPTNHFVNPFKICNLTKTQFFGFRGYVQPWILDFFQTLEKITGIPIKDMSDVILERPSGLSPRRSLRMEFAGVTRIINYLNRSGILSDYLREKLIVIFLDISVFLNNVFGVNSSLSREQLQRCNDVDSIVNQAFLSQLWGGQIQDHKSSKQNS